MRRCRSPTPPRPKTGSPTPWAGANIKNAKGFPPGSESVPPPRTPPPVQLAMPGSHPPLHGGLGSWGAGSLLIARVHGKRRPARNSPGLGLSFGLSGIQASNLLFFVLSVPTVCPSHSEICTMLKMAPVAIRLDWVKKSDNELCVAGGGSGQAFSKLCGGGAAASGQEGRPRTTPAIRGNAANRRIAALLINPVHSVLAPPPQESQSGPTGCFPVWQ